MYCSFRWTHKICIVILVEEKVHPTVDIIRADVCPRKSELYWVSARIEPMVELIQCSHRTVYTPGESIITVTGGSKRPGTIHVLYSEHKQHKSTFHSISQYTAARSSGVVFITASRLSRAKVLMTTVGYLPFYNDTYSLGGP